jgi:hypothetical protein
LARNEAAIDVIYRHYSNIVERSETVVDIFVKVVDCRVFILNRASHCGYNGGIIEISCHFSPRPTSFSPSKWSIFRLYTTKEGMPTPFTISGVMLSLMRFEWSYNHRFRGHIIFSQTFGDVAWREPDRNHLRVLAGPGREKEE